LDSSLKGRLGEEDGGEIEREKEKSFEKQGVID